MFHTIQKLGDALRGRFLDGRADTSGVREKSETDSFFILLDKSKECDFGWVVRFLRM
jgi:hypothetical protein